MKKARILAALTLLSLLVVSYSALPLIASVEPDSGVIITAARCCTYGSDCATDKCCLAPNANEADCSQNRKNYCRTCPVAVEAEPASPAAPLAP